MKERKRFRLVDIVKLPAKESYSLGRITMKKRERRHER